MNGDWAKPVEAIDQAQKGDVIVIDADGGDTALWGALASRSCISKGINGVVINGSIRDTEEIKKMGFPAFAKNITPNAGDPKGFGEINIELRCCDVIIKPGDWVIGDKDGVVVIPQEKAVEIANRAMDVKEREERLEQEIKQNSTLSSILNLKKWEKIR
jgi:3-hexulose-6-phosphate synthase/6-phospho-3-hexuloisomerase